MTAPTITPYGRWTSPIMPARIAAGQVELGEPSAAGPATYWLESRPQDDGRTTLVRHTPAEGIRDVTPAWFDCRTRVHEYGGGAYLVHGDVVFASHAEDQRIYRLQPGSAPRAITPPPSHPGALRYADARMLPTGELVCVRERHDGGEVVNELVTVPANGDGEPRVIASGRDFYACPRPSPDGRRLAWQTWDHPRMPWDGCDLWLARIAPDGGLEPPRHVAGGERESIFQPLWGPDGALYFASDVSGWWNLHRLRDDGVEPVAPMEAEVGEAQWCFGQASYTVLPDGRVACVARRGRLQQLMLVGLDGVPAAIELPFTSFDVPCLRSCGRRLTFIAGSPTRADSVVSLDIDTTAVTVLRTSFDPPLDEASISVSRAYSFQTAGGATAHAHYYAAANRAHRAPPGELPPAIVISHGGPTGQAYHSLDLRVQQWTTRGYAVIDVDYRGSSGYGRAYREALNGAWGIADVEDCVNAAQALAGVVDQDRLFIRGGSAGGYTTLCALTYHDVFAAGASWFGVGDLEALARDTHKFESRYLDGLVGPYPAAAARYRERSPVHAADRLRRPMIIFQGLLDPVVAPSQAEAMVAALQAAGVPHRYLPFADEEHGFRHTDNRRRALEAELEFFGSMLATRS